MHSILSTENSIYLLRCAYDFLWQQIGCYLVYLKYVLDRYRPQCERLLLNELRPKFSKFHEYDSHKFLCEELALLLPTQKSILLKYSLREKTHLSRYPLHTCQFTTRYLVKSVLSFVILTNAYKILPVFNSSVNSVRPPSPVDTTLSTFVCAS